MSGLMENIKYEEFEATLCIGHCPRHGSNEFIDAVGWRTATKGLIVARPLDFAPESAVDFNTACPKTYWRAGESDDSWTVIHRRSGLPLLLGSECFTRQKEAFKFAKRMGKYANWTYAEVEPDDVNEVVQGIYSARRSVLREMESEMAGLVVYDEDFDPPFIISIERTEGGRTFHVLNKVDGKTAASFPHRGLAAAKAVELNLEAMV